MKRIKVAIADDHKLFRDGVLLLLSTIDEIEAVFDAENGQQLLNKMKQVSDDERPDVVLVDLKMPVLDGMQTTRAMLQDFPDVRIIILTMIDDDDYILTALDHGAHGYLLKDTSKAELKEAIEAVYTQGHYFNAKTSQAMLKGLKKKGKAASLSNQINVTSREHEVLQLICEEMTTQEIADQLFLSIRTVESHRKNIMDKLDAKNTAGLVLKAVKAGLVA